MTSQFLKCIVLVGALVVPLALEASSGGMIGRTARNGTGCGTSQCHAGAANTNTTVFFEGLNDSTTVVAGSTTTFSVVVSHASAPAAGVNIAAKTTVNGGENAGTLQVVSGGNLQLLGPELTHFTPVQFETGTVRFTFNWTAPAAPGVYFLRAIANAVNLDGGRSAADQWNWAPVLAVRVVADEPNAVGELADNDPLAALGISPMPAHDVITLTTPATPGSTYTINVLDLTGSTVFVDNVMSSDNVLRYVWNGTTSAGIQALPGSYVVAISGNGSVKRGRAVIVR